MIAKDNTVKEIDNEINISYKNFIAKFQKNSKLEDNLKVENLDLENLIDYINNNHHKHIKASISLIQDHLAKISETHNYHEITTVLNLFIKLKFELLQHYYREEKVLFRYIKSVLAIIKDDIITNSVFDIINSLVPIVSLEERHDVITDIIYEIKKLLDNYSPPFEVCQSYKEILNEIKNLEKNLQENLSIEREILFPKIRQI